MFQANNIHTLGESKTGMYSYQVWLWRFPLVIAMHDSADWDSSEPWVSENMFEVTLSGPSWVENI